MKYFFFLLFIACIFFACQNAGTSAAADQNDAYVQLAPAAFKEKLATVENPQLIDVRTPREYEKGTIDGAVMINYKDKNFAAETAKLNKNRPLFIFCQSGGRSRAACTQLANEGFTEVYELKGGYGSWK